MNITISNEFTDELHGPFELSGDMTLEDLLALLEFDDSSQTLWLNMKQLDINNKADTLEDLGLKNEDLLLIRRKNVSTQAPGNLGDNSATDEQYLEQFRQYLLQNPQMGEQMGFANLRQVLSNKNEFHRLLGPMLLTMRGERSDNPFGIPNSEYEKLMSNPDDPVNQAKIAELINQREIDEQLKYAMEYTPEAFAQVSMLYVKLEINGHPVKAFVDSGAQTTIMSTKLAERTGLTSLIDKRFSGIAQGVGTGKIIGRIHTTQIKIHDVFLPCTFTVLDTPMEMLLGLDMLRRHRACIDLKNNMLHIADAETPFLPENEIPKESNGLTTTQTKPSKEAAKIDNDPMKRTHSTVSENNPESESQKKQSKPLDSQYPEPHIKQLTDLGFSREEALEALHKTGGNIDYAASLLFQ